MVCDRLRSNPIHLGNRYRLAITTPICTQITWCYQDSSSLFLEFYETSSLVRKFKQLVLDRFLEEHSDQEYAGRIGVSQSRLRGAAEGITEYSPSHSIMENLAIAVKRLLTHNNSTSTLHTTTTTT